MTKSISIVFAGLVLVQPMVALAGGRYDSLRISELYFDAPGSADIPSEYIELRGVPGTPLDDHYLVILESEGLSGSDGLSGNVDAILDLSGRVIGTNGFATFRQFNAAHVGIRAGTADYRNTQTSLGFGTSTAGNLGWRDTNNNGRIENGGFSAFLVRVEGTTRPQLEQDLDVENDGQLDSGVDYAAPGTQYLYQNAGDPSDRWAILDSIGQTEAGEAGTGRAYAAVHFSLSPLNPANMTAGSVNVNTGSVDDVRDIGFPQGGIEPEYLARWGGSSGSAPEDFTVSNLTDNAASGYTSANRWRDGFRVSGDHATRSRGEFFRGFVDEAAPYGAVVQNTLGRPNYPIADGDLSQNERIDQADLDIVLDNWFVTDAGRLGYWLFGDAAGGPLDPATGAVNGDGTVDRADLDFVLDRWPLASSPLFAPADMRFLAGDTDLSGTVEFTDLVTLAQNYGQGLRGYRNGDFDHDGLVSFADLVALAQRYGLSWGGQGEALPFGNAEFALLRSIGVVVPEPAALGCVSLLMLAATRRRRG